MSAPTRDSVATLMMLRYVLAVTIAWTLFFVVWYLLAIPFGPGSPVHLD